MAEMRSIAIPEELCRAAEEKFACRFQNVEEMLSELLKQILRDDAVTMDAEEQQVIEERLRGLGYV